MKHICSGPGAGAAGRGQYQSQSDGGCVIVDAEGNIVVRAITIRPANRMRVNALAEAKQMAQGATAYVTLEPCAHYGRTGPCCVALARAGIGKVVVACLILTPRLQVRVWNICACRVSRLLPACAKRRLSAK